MRRRRFPCGSSIVAWRRARRFRRIGRLGDRCRWSSSRRSDIHEAEEPADSPSGLEPLTALGIDNQHTGTASSATTSATGPRASLRRRAWARPSGRLVAPVVHDVDDRLADLLDHGRHAPGMGSPRAPSLVMTTTATGFTPPPPPEPPSPPCHGLCPFRRAAAAEAGANGDERDDRCSLEGDRLADDGPVQRIRSVSESLSSQASTCSMDRLHC